MLLAAQGNVTYGNGTFVNGTMVNTTAQLQLSDVPVSVVASKLTALTNASTSPTLLGDLSAALSTALVSAGAPPLAAPLAKVAVSITVRSPPPPLPPPFPPGENVGTLLAQDKADRRNRRQIKDLQEAGSAVAYALLGVIVLWMPVHALFHAITAAHARRTAVSVALALRVVHRAPRASQPGGDPNAAPDKEDEGDDEALAGKRFAARNLAAALASALQREASAAGAADLQPAPKAIALRPLLRTPLVAALGAKATGNNASQRLAARNKPTGMAWRFKRWLLSELHWQAREMRHTIRALRRCGGGSRDPVGKVFRLVSAGASCAIVVEATFSFGWSGRRGAACWRRRLRCEEQLAALEAALIAELADPKSGMR